MWLEWFQGNEKDRYTVESEASKFSSRTLKMERRSKVNILKCAALAILSGCFENTSTVIFSSCKGHALTCLHHGTISLLVGLIAWLDSTETTNLLVR